MKITQHYDDKDKVSRVEIVTNDELGLTIDFSVWENPSQCLFDEIQVSESNEETKETDEKFYFKYGFGANAYRIAGGFLATDLLKQDNQELREFDNTSAKLKRLFYNEETKENVYGCILEVGFERGYPKTADVFDLVDGVLVPVATVLSNGSVLKKEGYSENVQIEQERSTNARSLKRLKLSEQAM